MGDNDDEDVGGIGESREDDEESVEEAEAEESVDDADDEERVEDASMRRSWLRGNAYGLWCDGHLGDGAE